MLDKGLRKNIKNKRNDGKFVKYKLNEMGALNRRGETNQIKVKDHRIVQLFLNMAAHQKGIWSFGDGKKQCLGIFFFF